MFGSLEIPAIPPSASSPGSAPCGSGATYKTHPRPLPRSTYSQLRKAELRARQLSLAVEAPDTSVAQLRESVRQRMRNVPGVYLMKAANGMLLYVGKSTRVRTRVLSYFRLPWPEHRHARMLREVASIDWEPQPSEFAALLREVRLIRAHMPPYNTRSARPLHKCWVITIGSGVAPGLRVQRASAAMNSKDVAEIVGPFSARRPLVEAVRVLSDALGLRDCADTVSMHMRDEVELFDSSHPAMRRTPACHRYETGRCLGPCIGAVHAAEYRTRLNRAREVLQGRDDSPRQNLVREMAAASAAMSYERAGWLRDRLAALETLHAQLERVRNGFIACNCVAAVRGAGEDDRLYLVRNGRVVQEARVNDHRALAGMRRMEGSQTLSYPASQAAPLSSYSQASAAMFIAQLDEVLLVQSWLEGRVCEVPLVSGNVDGALTLLGHTPAYSTENPLECLCTPAVPGGNVSDQTARLSTNSPACFMASENAG